MWNGFMLFLEVVVDTALVIRCCRSYVYHTHFTCAAAAVVADVYIMRLCAIS